MATASSRVLPKRAPISSASSLSTAAPPIIIVTLPFRPAASIADIRAGMSFFTAEVFIETAMMSALTSFAFEANVSAGALLPRSKHLNPAFLRDFRTISFGVMCGSRAPITTVPIGFVGSGGSFSIMDFNQDIKIPSFC